MLFSNCGRIELDYLARHGVGTKLVYRRYIRALMPRGTVPPVCLIGSRADKVGKPAQLISALREHANADGAELPEIIAHFAFDCRGAAWPLRDWYVAQHDALVGAAPPVPRVIDAALQRKQAWSEEKRGLRAMPWGEFANRLRREVRELHDCDDYALKALASHLHDTYSLILSSMAPRLSTRAWRLSGPRRTAGTCAHFATIFSSGVWVGCRFRDALELGLSGLFTSAYFDRACTQRRLGTPPG